MLQNHLRTALRTLRRNKSVTLINLAGLTAGLAACLVIMLFVLDELSFDNYHKDIKRLYRVGAQITTREETTRFAAAHVPLAPFVAANVPGIESAARFCGAPPQVVRLPSGQSFYEKNNYYYADPALLQILTIPFLQGNAASALQQPDDVIIAASLANKYFGREEALGRTLSFDNCDWIVAGVFADIPHNSHLPVMQIITRYQPPDWAAGWDGLRVPTYIKLSATANPHVVEERINNLAATATGDMLTSLGETRRYFMQSLQDIHLHSAFIQDYARLGNSRTIYIFSALALVILLIAALNYINLSTAGSLLRHKEIGIRRVIGANKIQVLAQFLGESLLFTITAFIAAIIITLLLVPVLRSMTGVALNIYHMTTLSFILPVLILLVLLSLVAGYYPAVLASGHNPVTAFRGGSSPLTGRGALRKALVIIQFTAASVLLIVTLVAWRQVHYMRGKDLGFDKQQMLVLPMQDEQMMANASQQLSTIKQEFKAIPGVAAVTAILRTPGQIEHHDDIEWNDSVNTVVRGMNNIFVDFDFMDAYSIHLAAGRSFDPNITSDTGGAFIINESAARSFGWANAQEALGKRLSFWMGSGTIIGVCKDFHLWSLHRPIEPLFFLIPPKIFPEVICAKLTATNPAVPLQQIREKWSTLFPGYPFDYYFLDEDFNRQYRADELFNRTILLFAGLALLIACIGLFGLVSILVGQRGKEIGIRKILGSTSAGIAILLNLEYLKLAGLAALLSWPLAWIAARQWLQGFAFQISFPYADLLLTAMALLLITVLTICGKSIRAANTNPVKTLRYE